MPNPNPNSVEAANAALREENARLKLRLKQTEARWESDVDKLADKCRALSLQVMGQFDALNEMKMRNDILREQVHALKYPDQSSRLASNPNSIASRSRPFQTNRSAGTAGPKKQAGAHQGF
jgi:hypothetical protein